MHRDILWSNVSRGRSKKYPSGEHLSRKEHAPDVEDLRISCGDKWCGMGRSR
jgi:hypothetical protein